MLLIIGDSFACLLSDQIKDMPGVKSLGKRGGKITNRNFFDWCIEMAQKERPEKVLIIAGGNDIATDYCKLSLFLKRVGELNDGLRATGVSHVYMLPVPPRINFRGTLTKREHARRRRVVNAALKKFVVVAPVPRYPADQFLGRDGVHPSSVGWQFLRRAVADLME